MLTHAADRICQEVTQVKNNLAAIQIEAAQFKDEVARDAIEAQIRS